MRSNSNMPDTASSSRQRPPGNEALLNYLDLLADCDVTDFLDGDDETEVSTGDDQRRPRRRSTDDDDPSRYFTSDMEQILRQSIDEFQSTLEVFQQARRGLPRGDTYTTSLRLALDPSSVEIKVPAASDEAVAKLPHARVLPDDKKRFAHDQTPCQICLESLVSGVVLIRMPCGHLSHAQCATAWFRRAATCPECRYELPSKDPKLEAGRAERMKDRRVVACDCHPSGIHTCFFVDPSKSLVEQYNAKVESAASKPAETASPDGIDEVLDAFQARMFF